MILGIVDRMLFREVFKTLVLILAVILLLLFANTLVRLLGQVAAGLLQLELLWVLVGYQLLQMLGSVMPAAFFVALVWVLGRLRSDNELTALGVAGVGPMRLYRGLFVVALPVALLSAILMLEIFPAAKAHSHQVRLSQAARVGLEAVRPGVFNEFDQGRVMVFAETVDVAAGRIGGVFIQHWQEGKPGLVTADTAELRSDPNTGQRLVVLNKGFRYQGVPGQEEFSLGSFREYGLRLPELDAPLSKPPMGARPTPDLWASASLEDRAELQDRLSYPLAILGFTLLSVPLARGTPRQGQHGRILVAILIYVLYMNLQNFAEAWMAAGRSPDWLGVWWLQAALVLSALIWHLLARLRGGVV